MMKTRPNWRMRSAIIVRARGMTETAKKSDMSREALYKALRPGSAPRFVTISKVMKALGRVYNSW